ncbi:hypothetical protein [Candidatus Pyrohabitans sp.]
MRQAILFLLFFIAAAGAAGAYEEERELEAGAYDDYVELMSSFENQSLESRLEARLYTEGGEGPLALEFEHSLESAGYEEEAEIRVTFEALVEFVDKNGDGGFTRETDEVIQEIPLGDRGTVIYGRPALEKLTTGGSQGYKLTAGGVTPEGAGFEVSGILFSTPATYGAESLSPTEMKVLVRIWNFPFEEEDSRVALRAKVYSEKGVEADGSYFYTESETSLVYFDWLGTVTSDGSAASAAVTSALSDDEWLVFVAYPRGGEVVHDPIAGVVQKGQTKPAPASAAEGKEKGGICGPTALLLLSLLPTAVYLSLKRRT